MVPSQCGELRIKVYNFTCNWFVPCWNMHVVYMIRLLLYTGEEGWIYSLQQCSDGLMTIPISMTGRYDLDTPSAETRFGVTLQEMGERRGDLSILRVTHFYEVVIDITVITWCRTKRITTLETIGKANKSHTVSPVTHWRPVRPWHISAAAASLSHIWHGMTV